MWRLPFRFFSHVRIFIGNLPHNYDIEELNKIIPGNPKYEKSSIFCFVNISDTLDVNKILSELNQTKIGDQMIRAKKIEDNNSRNFRNQKNTSYPKNTSYTKNSSDPKNNPAESAVENSTSKIENPTSKIENKTKDSQNASFGNSNSQSFKGVPYSRQQIFVSESENKQKNQSILKTKEYTQAFLENYSFRKDFGLKEPEKEFPSKMANPIKNEPNKHNYT